MTELYGTMFFLGDALLPYFEVETILSNMENPLGSPSTFYMVDIPNCGVGRKPYMVAAVDEKTEQPVSERQRYRLAEAVLLQLNIKYGYTRDMLTYEFKPYEKHWEKEVIHK